MTLRLFPVCRTLCNASFVRACRRLHSSSTSRANGHVTTTEELDELRERTREFTRREIPEHVAARTDRENEFPNDMWKKLGDAGFLGITAEEEYGGLAMGYQAHCIVMEEISRASGSIGLSYAAHSQLCINQLSLHGTAEQKEKYLPSLISGDKIGALAMSEHNAGSDVVSMKTTAKEVDGGWVIDGTKMWITNGPDADVVVLYAKTAPSKGAHGISAFVVDTHPARSFESTTGFSVTQKFDKLGMRGSNTGELAFDGMFVPSSALLGPLNGGVRILMSGLDIERLVLSSGPVGIMQACLDATLPYIHSRTQFGRPIATFPAIHAHLATMYTSVMSARALTMTLARNLDTISSSPEIPSHTVARDCAAAILHASERATQVALLAIQCLGGMGYVNDMPVGRLLRDAKLYEIGAGTQEIRRNVIGRAFNRDFSI